jgi:hypothetical protein
LAHGVHEVDASDTYEASRVKLTTQPEQAEGKPASGRSTSDEWFSGKVILSGTEIRSAPLLSPLPAFGDPISGAKRGMRTFPQLSRGAVFLSTVAMSVEGKS